MIRDKEFKKVFEYDFDFDCYLFVQDHHEVMLYKEGETYVVNTYEYEKGKKVYVGNDEKEAVQAAIAAVKNTQMIGSE